MAGQRNVWSASLASLLCPVLGMSFVVAAADLPTPERTPVEIQEGTSQKQAEPAPLALKMDDATDASRIARDLTLSYLSKEQWTARVADVRRKFADWEKENEGDIGSYLNYRLPIVALSVAGGKIERLKEGAAFVALYYEFSQPVPQGVTAFARQNMASLSELFGAFTWEKAADYVKNRQWQKSRDEKKSSNEKK